MQEGRYELHGLKLICIKVSDQNRTHTNVLILDIEKCCCLRGFLEIARSTVYVVRIREQVYFSPCIILTSNSDIFIIRYTQTGKFVPGLSQTLNKQKFLHSISGIWSHTDACDARQCLKFFFFWGHKVLMRVKRCKKKKKCLSFARVLSNV